MTEPTLLPPSTLTQDQQLAHERDIHERRIPGASMVSLYHDAADGPRANAYLPASAATIAKMEAEPQAMVEKVAAEKAKQLALVEQWEALLSLRDEKRRQLNALDAREDYSNQLISNAKKSLADNLISDDYSGHAVCHNAFHTYTTAKSVIEIIGTMRISVMAQLEQCIADISEFAEIHGFAEMPAHVVEPLPAPRGTVAKYPNTDTDE